MQPLAEFMQQQAECIQQLAECLERLAECLEQLAECLEQLTECLELLAVGEVRLPRSIIRVSHLIELNLLPRTCFTDGLDMSDGLRLDNLS
jgi:hypothetical protein